MILAGMSGVSRRDYTAVRNIGYNIAFRHSRIRGNDGT